MVINFCTFEIGCKGTAISESVQSPKVAKKMVCHVY